MSQKHQDEIERAFSEQASAFASGRYKLSDPRLLEWILDFIPLAPNRSVLDVCAGTGILGLAMAPQVARVVALDQTEAMMAEGRKEAARRALENVSFESGSAEQLPYTDGSFDLVTMRLGLHHLEQPDIAIGEMVRVCRRGGHVAIIDLGSPENPDEATLYNQYERLRDTSHVRALTVTEIITGCQRHGLHELRHSVRDVPVEISSWMEMAKTEPAAREQIVRALDDELSGGTHTGMRPRRKGTSCEYLQRWVAVCGLKKGEA